MLYAFFQGLMIAFGIVVGFLVPFFYIVHKIRKRSAKKKYEIPELILAFEKYLHDVTHDENYEIINEINGIIDSLKKGVTPEIMETYNIKKDVSILIKDNKGGQHIKFINEYKIIGKIISS